jgi:hypothetical protein
MESQTVRLVRLPKGGLAERRNGIRFPVNLEVRYAIAGGRAPLETGSGRTIDMSSTGLRLTADRPLRVGQVLEVSVDWPVLLDGSVQLQLMMSGAVIRAKGTDTALQIERHEFKTRRAGLKFAHHPSDAGPETRRRDLARIRE